MITVTTTYPGASADLIQGFITDADRQGGVDAENIDYVTSQSRPRRQHRHGAACSSAPIPNAALTEVLVEGAAGARRSCRPTPRTRSIVKGTGQNFALMYLAVASPNMTPEQVTEYLERVDPAALRHRRGRRPRSQILGGRDFAMRVWIDPVRLAARDVTAAEVLTAIRASQLPRPRPARPRTSSSPTRIADADDAADAGGLRRAAARGPRATRWCACATSPTSSSAPKSTDTSVTFNGRTGTFIGIIADAGRQPARRWPRAVTRRSPTIQADAAAGHDDRDRLRRHRTSSRASIEEVFKTIAEAVAIVVVVILLFLGSFRSVLMPVVTIPLSLIGVCFVLFALGYSINLLTLLAMVLAIGLVVDDAIVVVENIHRHIEEGLTPIEAAIVGHARDLRAGRRDDDHAGRRLRADRLHQRPDRRAVPRIRLHAGRRGGDLRHRRA